MRKNNLSYGRILVMMAVIVGLFVMGASTASARPFTTDFTGISTCVDVPGTGDYIFTESGHLHIIGAVSICTDIANDPRVAGKSTIVVNGIFDLADNISGPMWGSYYLDNDGGSWTATWTGERTSDGFAFIRQHGRGLAGYAGMQAWWDLERFSPFPADPYSFTGHILDPGN